MKITVLGNCQTGQLVHCLTALAPGVTVTRQLDRTVEGLQDSDLIIAQRNVGRFLDDLPPSKVRLFPRISFSAYHPDVLHSGGRLERSPIGGESTNSSLALFGWLRGLSAAETVALFREDVFEKLGYFDHWGAAKKLLLEEGSRSKIAFDELFESWAKSGCFMYSPRHPKGFVIADIARVILRGVGITPADVPAENMPDAQGDGVRLPVYPEIAAKLGIEGSYAFQAAKKPDHQRRTLNIEEFVRESFLIFDKVSPNKDEFRSLQSPAFRDLAEQVRKPNSAPWVQSENPYTGLPPHQFWRPSIEKLEPGSVDPVHSAPFKLDRETKIATAGSCFAQHISRTLAARGFNYLIGEAAPEDMPAEDAHARNFGVFSARYGNLYTARQLVQLFDRAFRTFVPKDEVWERPDGRLADPFRPQIEPDGFESLKAVRESRRLHMRAVRRLFRQLDVLVFTLGLTEAWRAKSDGAVFPLAPGVAAGRMDPAKYEFVNFRVQDVISDLAEFVQRLESVNRRAKIILTVSPVPLIATYEDRHVLVSTTYSKSVLRVAAQETAAAFKNVWYFPSYEVITGNFNRGAYFEDDLRSVTQQGVDHVMRLFVEHATVDGEVSPASQRETEVAEREAEMRRGFEIVCDEEAIEEAAE